MGSSLLYFARNTACIMKGGIKMITLITLAIIGVVMAVCSALTIGVSSLAFLFVFGDLIVFGAIVAIVAKCFTKKK